MARHRHHYHHTIWDLGSEAEKDLTKKMQNIFMEYIPTDKILDGIIKSYQVATYKNDFINQLNSYGIKDYFDYEIAKRQRLAAEAQKSKFDKIKDRMTDFVDQKILGLSEIEDVQTQKYAVLEKDHKFKNQVWLMFDQHRSLRGKIATLYDFAVTNMNTYQNEPTIKNMQNISKFYEDVKDAGLRPYLVDYEEKFLQDQAARKEQSAKDAAAAKIAARENRAENIMVGLTIASVLGPLAACGVIAIYDNITQKDKAKQTTTVETTVPSNPKLHTQIKMGDAMISNDKDAAGTEITNINGINFINER